MLFLEQREDLSTGKWLLNFLYKAGETKHQFARFPLTFFMVPSLGEPSLRLEKSRPSIFRTKFCFVFRSA
jgi:hypothetical protein